MATKTEEKTSEDKLTAARNKNLDLAIQQIAKDYGDGAIMRLGDDKIVDIDVIPTGNVLIDRALGVGGFPRGRVVEVFGPESSGKTTLTLTVIAQAQKRGGLAAFIDVEHALDPAYAKKLGVDLDDLLGIVQVLSTQNGDPPLPDVGAWDEQREQAWDEDVRRFAGR